jgi:hypothetical protein
MASRTLPGLGLTGFWDLGADLWKDGMDTNLRTLSALTQARVESATSALPGSPTDGVMYVVLASDGTNPKKIAIRDNGAWVYIAPVEGLVVYAKDTHKYLKYSGTAWVDMLPANELPSITGNNGKRLAVTDDATGVLWVSPEAISYPAMVGNTGKHLAVNSAENGVEWVAASGGTTLPTLTGQALKHLAVKSDESGVQWVTESSGTTLPSLTGNDNKVLTVNTGGTAVVWTTPSSGTTLPSLTGNALKHLAVNSGETAVQWVAETLELPSFSGNALRHLAVNSGGTAAVWVDDAVTLINTQTASYTLVLADLGKYVRMNVATANTLTVPPNSSVAFAIGSVITLRQYGVGQTTVVAGSGVTINTAETLKLRKRHSSVSLIKIATDEWDITGDVELGP